MNETTGCRRLLRPSVGLFILLLAVLPQRVVVTPAFAASPSDAGIFSVAPPTGDPAVDLAAILAALAQAKTWQAGQPKGADGLAAQAEIVLGPGTYKLCPAGGSPAPNGGAVGGNYCLQLNNWENLTFRGTDGDTKIVLLNPNDGYILMFQSRHMTVANLTLDFQIPPFTQGKIVSINTKGSALLSIDVQLDEGFQSFADPIYQTRDHNFLTIMDPITPRPKPGVPDFMRIAYNPAPYSKEAFAYGTLLPDRKTWRLTFEPKGPAWQFTDPRHPPIVPGDRFVYVTRLPNAGVMAGFCDTVTLTHLTFHASGALTTAFVENTGPLLIDHLDIRIPPGSRRLISIDADGAHFQNDRGPVTIQYSSFQGMADDAIAIYSLATTIHQVLSVGANGKIIDYSPRRILQGDQLQILDSTTGAIRGMGTVTQVESFKCPPDAVGVRCYNVTLDMVPDNTNAEDIAYIYNAAGNGASIHHNVFQAHRGNGILLFSSHSTVADNEFIDVPKDGITIGPYHADFHMGPVPDHVLVQRNSLTGGEPNGGRHIRVTSVIPKSGAQANQVNAVQGPSDITISDNSFRNPIAPAIEVAVGDRIRLANDKITLDSSVVRVPGPAVRLSAGTEFSVNELSVSPGPGTSAAVEIGCGVSALDTSSWTIRSARVRPLLDRRSDCR